MFVYFNPNPDKRLVGDCVVRAICKLTDQDWDTIFEGHGLFCGPPFYFGGTHGSELLSHAPWYKGHEVGCA